MNWTPPTAGRTALVVLIVVAVVLVPLAASSAIGSNRSTSDGAHLTVRGVTVDPETPVAGEQTTVTATIRNDPESTEAVEITDVAIRTADENDFREYRRVEDLGSLTPGNDIDVPLAVSFDDEGHHILRVHVWGTTESGQRVHLTYPVTVEVRSERGGTDAAVSLSTDEAVAGVEQTVNATLVNARAQSIKNVEVALSGPNVDVLDGPAIEAEVPAGSEREYSFDVVANGAGTHQVTAQFRYVTSDGETVTKERTLELSVDPLDEHVDLSASSDSRGDTVRVEVANLGNAPVEDVTVRLSDPSGWSTLELLDQIDPHSRQTVTIDTSQVPNGTTVDVELTYTLAGETRRNVTSVDVPGSDRTLIAARIELTGIDVEREDGKIHVSGSASNLGETEAKSVVVSVVSTEAVEPAFPGRKYFVGTVPASDFAAFDVYAEVDDDASTIQIEVTYLVDGEETRRTVSIPLGERNETGERAAGARVDGGMLPLFLGGTVVLGVTGIMGLAWWNYRSRD